MQWMLRNKITDTYKIDHNDTISQINDALKFAKKNCILKIGKGNLKWKMLMSYLKTIKLILKISYDLG